MIRQLSNLHFLFYLQLFFTPISASALTYDLTLGGNYRSSPRGGTAYFELGAGQSLWGDQKEPTHGFTRLFVRSEGVENYNSTEVGFEFFPISILGLQLGSIQTQNHADYEAFDCHVYLCRGKFQTNYWQVPLFLKFHSIIGAASYRSSRVNWSGQNQDSLFIDPTYGLPLSDSLTDSVQSVRGALLYEAYPWLRFGVAFIKNSAENKKEIAFKDRSSEFRLGLAQFIFRYNSDDSYFKFQIGAGEYQSAIQTTEATVIVGLEWSPMNKLGY